VRTSWTIQNPSSAGDQYVFVRNPKASTSPFPAKNITVASTNILRSQLILQEGFRSPASWSFSGTFTNLKDYQDMVAWYRRDFRLWLLDDLGQRLTILITGLTVTRNAQSSNVYRQDFSVAALVFSVETL
jgi:hypothetical protein